MPRDFIKVSTEQAVSRTHGALLLTYVNQLHQTLVLGERILGIMNNNHDGTDFTAIESLFGVGVGRGRTIFDLVNGSVGSMKGTFQTADAQKLTQIVGGGA